eukprot:4480767-Prymnesium_polylepis.1
MGLWLATTPPPARDAPRTPQNCDSTHRTVVRPPPTSADAPTATAPSARTPTPAGEPATSSSSAAERSSDAADRAAEAEPVPWSPGEVQLGGRPAVRDGPSSAGQQQRRVGSLEQLEGLQIPCSGVGLAELCNLFELEPLPEPYGGSYPFATHTGSTAWTWPTFDGTIYARECAALGCMFTPLLQSDEEPATMCTSCIGLIKLSALKALLERATKASLPTTTKNMYLSHAQIASKVSTVRTSNSLQRVKMWAMRKRISKVAAPIAEYKQMVALLARNRIPRV